MSRVGVVAPNTLLGRELRDRLAARTDLFGEPRLLSADEEEIGQLAESGGAAAFVGRLDEHAFDGLEVVFFCGAIGDDRPWLSRLPESAVAVVLSAGARAGDGVAALAGVGAGSAAGRTLLVPHPAAAGLALVLARLAPFGVRAAQAVALLPVSLGGAAAIDELFEQTRDLLNFQRRAGGAARPQTAFNLTPAADDADDVARQALQALDADFPLSLQLLAAGVFHGVGLSLRVELARSPGDAELRRALAADPRLELARKPAAVSPVALAGSESLRLVVLRRGAAPGELLLWAAFDNLTRGGALCALELAEELLAGAGRPS